MGNSLERYEYWTLYLSTLEWNSKYNEKHTILSVSSLTGGSETINIVSGQGWVTQSCYYNPLTPQELSLSHWFLCMKGSDNSQLPVSYKLIEWDVVKLQTMFQIYYICSEAQICVCTRIEFNTNHKCINQKKLNFHRIWQQSFYWNLELCRLGGLVSVPLCAGSLQGVVT